MPCIFISYRRSDSSAITGRIYDRLVATFGKGNVFKDVDSIPPGSDFRQVVNKAVERCDVLVAVVGAHWLDAADEQGCSRLSLDTDVVRLEIEAALRRGIAVIPVLVDGAKVPRIDQLPISLQDISYRHASPVRHDPDFHHDMDRLIQALKAGKTRRRSPFGVILSARSIFLAGFVVAAVCGIVGQEGRAFRRMIGLDGPKQGEVGPDAKPVGSDRHAAQSEAAQPSPEPLDASTAPESSSNPAPAPTADSDRADLRPPFKISDRALRTLVTERTVTAVLSCSAGEVSFESEKLNNGVFSHFLIQGLKDQTKDAGKQGINLEELYLFVKRRVVEYSQSEFHRKQTPQMISQGEGDVVLMRQRQTELADADHAQGWALLVGVNKAAGEPSPLRFAGKDALDLRDALVAGGYRPDRVRVLTDELKWSQMPTKRGVLEALLQVSALASPDDEIIVAFSGSGVSIEKVGEYVVPSDGDPDSVESLVPIRDVFDILEKSAARRKVVFIDACRISASRYARR
jgi:uncharacterized caspase-like protein